MKRRANLFLILTAIGLFALILLLTIPAWASTTPDTGLPAGITCEMVREKVAEHGKAVALAWALKQGYSFAQIRAARRCVK
ncbi:hypothetical protein [Bradyrhizobium sp. 87]|uniref:hypothetical protein n=1 Tax=Bradyrhizobium sp. 87 TaxID=2782682 RepID=UPI001FFBEFDD|nr:hypothetical protein [Bradyrhizobium sp. 87]MCK1430917.1 hypothetical protein [Bradyrhizobium sp. 87]